MNEILWNQIAWIALAVLVCALSLPVMRKILSKNERLLYRVGLLLLILYLLVNLYLTLLSRSAHSARILLSPLYSYRAAFAIVKDGEFGLYIKSSRMLKLITLNILLYIPLGYLLPLAFPRLLKPRHSAPSRRLRDRLKAFPWNIVLIGTAFSFVSELAQLILHLGFFELDDIINNTFGCFLGVSMYLLMMRRRHE